jgi:hypothetical protein
LGIQGGSIDFFEKANRPLVGRDIINVERASPLRFIGSGLDVLRKLLWS